MEKITVTIMYHFSRLNLKDIGIEVESFLESIMESNPEYFQHHEVKQKHNKNKKKQDLERSKIINSDKFHGCCLESSIIS